MVTNIVYLSCFMARLTAKMPYCAVPGCTNGTSTSNKTVSQVKFHRLPANRDVAAKWWQAIRREAELNSVKDPRVCSAHFPPGSFSSAGRPHPDVIPSLAIPGNPPKYVCIFLSTRLMAVPLRISPHLSFSLV